MVWSLIMAARSGCSVVRCMFCDQGVRVGQELLELEPRHATGVAGSAPVARPDPLVSPVGFL